MRNAEKLLLNIFSKHAVFGWPAQSRNPILPGMIDLTLPLLIFLAPLAYSPGPGNIFFATIGARDGFWGAARANAGYHLATFVVTLLVGLGFGWFAKASPIALDVIRYAGAAYMLLLAWRLLRAGTHDGKSEATTATFMDGVVLLLLNPKAYLIIAVMFSQFTKSGISDNWLRVFWITTVFTLNNLLAFTLWAYAGDRLAAQFRNPRQARQFNFAMGMMLAGVTVWMLLR